MNQHIFRPCVRIVLLPRLRLAQATEIASSPFTHNVCIVSWPANATRFGGATKKIIHVECQIYKDVGDVLETIWDFSLSRNFIQHNIVMCGAGGALDRGVRLQEEVPVAGLGDAAVDYCPTLGITTGVGVVGSRRTETGVVPTMMMVMCGRPFVLSEGGYMYVAHRKPCVSSGSSTSRTVAYCPSETPSR